MGDDYARKTWKEYFEDMYNVNSKERVAVNMCGLDGANKVIILLESR